MNWQEWEQDRNHKARAKGRWRELREVDSLGVHGRDAGGQSVVVFAANDYLGLSAHPAVRAAAHAAVDRWGTGAGASRLVSGGRPVHFELEARLAQWKSSPSALVFPTGYAANLGVLSALASPQVQICSDELNHASIIDGCRLAASFGAQWHKYRHVDVAAVEALVRAWPGRSLVVTDAVFSMDGDTAPIGELAALCAATGALLVVDEAHSVLGPHFGPLPCETVRVGTLSKVLGSQGGFAAGTQAVADLLVNRCRPFIYTTALNPASAAAALAALDVFGSDEGDQLRSRLEGYCRRICPAHQPPSPIVPLVLGTEADAVDAAAALLEMGLFIPAVRPPTVPPGTSRLRVSLSAAHSEEDLDRLEKALNALGLWPSAGPGGTGPTG